MSKKKKKIRIINNQSSKEYTFVNDHIRNNVIIKNNNEYPIYENSENKSNERMEKKKFHSKKIDNKGRKILGKSMQGHSPIYE
jgi:hypothetical protein